MAARRRSSQASAIAVGCALVASACGSSPPGHAGAGGGSGGGGAGGQGGAAGGATDGGSGGAPDAGPDSGPILAPQPQSPNIVVDQFGYRPAAEKIAVIRSPQQGFDAAMAFTPGATYALVDAHSGATVFEAAPARWNAGAVDPSSGDRAWWFDFSTVTAAGDYFVLDEARGVRSDVFSIADGVYRDVLVQAVRMLFYQRDGFAKTAPYAGAAWADGAAHAGPCYLYSDAGKTPNLDVHGGWWDAGDFNKYTSWGASDAIELLRAYAESPSAFSDDTNIPESGNAVPDVLDEIKWELDWMVRMQAANGSVLSIVGEPAAPAPAYGGSPNTAPSRVTDPCAYGPATTAASLSAAAAFAYGAVVLRSVAAAATVFPGYADDLASRAQRAWTWARANPAVFFYNSQATPPVGAGEQEVPQNQPDRGYALMVKQLAAAVYLFEATGDTTYRDFFDANYAGVNLIKTNYADASHGEEQETLLAYVAAPGATAAVVQKIKAAFATAVSTSANLGALQANPDPYLAYLPVYFWGSNQVKADQGNLLHDVITFGIDAAMNAQAARGAERYVHYVHGVNPLQIVYLSNMGAFGATRSVTRFFHGWFAKGSNWDAAGVSTYGPPPGYLTGGPNPDYTWDSCCPGNCSGVSCGAAQPSPPVGQPAQKAYLDFNDGWPLDSWAISEPDDGYQAKYIRLLSKFVP